jgi:hypothetical protein
LNACGNLVQDDVSEMKLIVSQLYQIVVGPHDVRACIHVHAFYSEDADQHDVRGLNG